MKTKSKKQAKQKNYINNCKHKHKKKQKSIKKLWTKKKLNDKIWEISFKQKLKKYHLKWKK